MRALLAAAGTEPGRPSETMRLILGPRINAGGRIGKSDLGERMLVDAIPSRRRRWARSWTP